jgi:hypothetical protein
MALFDFDDDQQRIVIGIAIGVGAAAVLKGFAPALRDLGRPIAKATIKSAIFAFEKSREQIAQLRETYEDLVAEVRSEMEGDMHGETEGIEADRPTSHGPEGEQ